MAKAAVPKAQPSSGSGKTRVAVSGWTFLTNHAHVLMCLADGEAYTTRELAVRVGITERAVQAIVADLIDAGYLRKSKVGRRNVYRVNPRGRLRHPLEAHHTVGDLIEALR